MADRAYEKYIPTTNPSKVQLNKKLVMDMRRLFPKIEEASANVARPAAPMNTKLPEYRLNRKLVEEMQRMFPNNRKPKLRVDINNLPSRAPSMRTAEESLNGSPISVSSTSSIKSVRQVSPTNNVASSQPPASQTFPQTSLGPTRQTPNRSAMTLRPRPNVVAQAGPASRSTAVARRPRITATTPSQTTAMTSANVRRAPRRFVDPNLISNVASSRRQVVQRFITDDPNIDNRGEVFETAATSPVDNVERIQEQIIVISDASSLGDASGSDDDSSTGTIADIQVEDLDSPEGPMDALRAYPLIASGARPLQGVCADFSLAFFFMKNLERTKVVGDALRENIEDSQWPYLDENEITEDALLKAVKRWILSPIFMSHEFPIDSGIPRSRGFLPSIFLIRADGSWTLTELDTLRTGIKYMKVYQFNQLTGTYMTKIVPDADFKVSKKGRALAYVPNIITEEDLEMDMSDVQRADLMIMKKAQEAIINPFGLVSGGRKPRKRTVSKSRKRKSSKLSAKKTKKARR